MTEISLKYFIKIKNKNYIFSSYLITNLHLVLIWKININDNYRDIYILMTIH